MKPLIKLSFIIYFPKKVTSIFILVVVLGFGIGAKAQDPKVVLPLGNTNDLTKTILSKSGKLLATIGFKEKGLFVWNVDNGYLLTAIYDANAVFGYKSAYFSNNEKYIHVRVDEDYKTYSLATGLEVKDSQFQDTAPETESTPDLKPKHSFTVQVKGDELVVEDSSNLKNLRKIQLYGKKVTKSYFSNDGKYLVIEHNVGIKIIKTDNWYSWPIINESRSLSFIYGEKLFVISKFRMLVYNLDNQQLVSTEKFTNPITNSLVKMDYKLIYGVSDTLITYNLVDLSKEKKKLDLNINNIIHEDNYLVIRDTIQTVIYDLVKKEVFLTLPELGSVWFTKNKNALIFTTSKEVDTNENHYITKFQLWDLKFKKPISSWEGLDEDIIDIDDSNQRILTNDKKYIYVYDILNGRLLNKWKWGGHIAFDSNLDITPNQNWLVSSGIWDNNKLAVVNINQFDKIIFSKDSRIMIGSIYDEEKEAIYYEIVDLEKNKKLFSNLTVNCMDIKMQIAKDNSKAVISLVYETKSTVYIYDLQSKNFKQIEVKNPNITSINILPNSTGFVLSYGDSKKLSTNGYAEIRMFKDPAIAKRIVGQVIYSNDGCFNNEGSILLTKSKGFIHFVDLKTLIAKQTVPVLGNTALYSPNNKFIITDALIIIDSFGKNPRKLAPNEEYKNATTKYIDAFEVLMPISFTPNGRFIQSVIDVAYGNTGMSNNTYIWDANTLSVLKKDEALQVFMSSTTNHLLSTDVFHPYTTKIINTLKNSAIKLKEQLDQIGSAIFTKNDKYLYTTSTGSVAKWKVSNGQLLGNLYTLDSLNYVVQLPNGYYKASPNGAKLLHYVTKDLKVITFEQLDIKYNRPDKVLEAMGSTDTTMINSYKRAYDKRIKKLNIDTNAFKSGYAVPSADFTNRPQIAFTQTKSQLTLHVSAKDETYILDRFNVWVNEVPLFGMLGENLKHLSKSTLDTTIVVDLSEGDNRIETSVINSSGAESYKMPLFVNYQPIDAIKSKTYFVGIGINQFEQKDHNLNYSVKDIRDLSISLKAKYGDDMILVDTLFDNRVTIENIAQLKTTLLSSKVNDKVIIAYSGHGLLSKNLDYYLSTYQIDFDNPIEKGLPYENLEKLLDNIPARKKLLLIDACHSGEVDKEDIKLVENTASERERNGVKGVDVKVVNKNKKIGMANSFELMQELFVNVGKSTGATVISAAGGTQYALEKGDLKNGVFTYSILELLRTKPTLKVNELKSTVIKRVLELTAGAQKPTSRNENIAVDWQIW